MSLMKARLREVRGLERSSRMFRCSLNSRPRTLRMFLPHTPPRHWWRQKAGWSAQVDLLQPDSPTPRVSPRRFSGSSIVHRVSGIASHAGNIFRFCASRGTLLSAHRASSSSFKQVALGQMGFAYGVQRRIFLLTALKAVGAPLGELAALGRLMGSTMWPGMGCNRSTSLVRSGMEPNSPTVQDGS